MKEYEGIYTCVLTFLLREEVIPTGTGHDFNFYI